MALFEMSRSLWGELRRKKQRRRGRTWAPGTGPWPEALEARLAPAVSTWSGAIDGLWSNDANWDVPPATGNDLVFPAGATTLSTANDLPTGIGFGSLTVASGGYVIGGAAVGLSGAVDASQAAGGSTVNLPINFSGPASVNVDHAGASLMLGGVLSGAGGLTKAGAGVLDLTAPNVYTGTTTVSAGELDVEGNQSGSPVTVASGATLGGAGTVGTITSNGGKVRPGTSTPAILNDAGDLALGTGSSFAVALNGGTPGTGYSQLTVAGQVNLGSATLDASAGFTPSGNDQFTILNNLGTGPVTGTFNGLAEGAPVTVSGQPFRISYVGGTGNDVVLTHLLASTTTLTSSSASSTFGAPVTLTATVTGSSGTPTGNVQFLSGTTFLGTGALINGVATLPTSLLPVGANQVTAQYQGDTTYDTSTSAAVPITVTQANTTTTVAVTPNPSGLGQPVTLSATVASVNAGGSAPTGTVEFFDGSTSLGTGTLNNGVATTSTSALTLGDHTITAKYQGDTNYLTSTSQAVTATVKQAATTTLTPSATSVASGQAITLTATVVASDVTSPNVPTGSVQFFNGTTSLGTAPLVGKTATLPNVKLPDGTASLTAQYQGDTNFGINTSPVVAVTVGNAATATTTTVAVTPSPSVTGQQITLTANVVSNVVGVGVPSGTVEFFSGTTSLGTAPLIGSVATLTSTGLTAGANSLTAQYKGDATFAASTSQSITATVNQAATTTTVTVAPDTSQSGQPVTLTASVAVNSPGAGTPTGSVQFFNGTTSLGTVTLTNGVATLTTSALTAGSPSITAQYQGDTNFAASTSPAVVPTVTQANAVVTVTASKIHPVTSEAVILTATVAASGTASGTPGGTVLFFANGVNIGSGTLTNGQATLTTSDLSVGNQTITAVYQGGANFTTATSSPLAMIVGDSNELFLNQVYLQLVRRPIDQPSLNQWFTLLVTGTPRRQIIRAIAGSSEAQAVAQQTGTIVPGVSLRLPRGHRGKVQRVNQIYLEVLGRTPTPHELRDGTRLLNSRHGQETLVVNLLSSNDFYARSSLNP